jgi:restriction system protein
MSVPTFQDLFWPSLLSLSDEKDHTLDEIFQAASKTLKLTNEEIEVRMKNSGMGVARYRTKWALTYLTKAELVTRVKRGTYRITDAGKKLTQKNYDSIDTNYLKNNYLPFKKWLQKARSGDEGVESPTPVENGTPIESIELNVNLLKEELGQQLLDHILRRPPIFFEHVVKTLLQSMGYGEGTVVGQSGDEGIDGFINEDALGLETIYYQAKRYGQGSAVPQSMIRDFIGTLQMHGKDKGVFITTSSLPKGVKEIAEKSHKKVVFINGEELVKLMIEYNVGVRTVTEIKIKAIDQDFFENEESL